MLLYPEGLLLASCKHKEEIRVYCSFSPHREAMYVYALKIAHLKEKATLLGINQIDYLLSLNSQDYY